MSSQYTQGFEAFNSLEFSKQQNLDFLSFTSPSDIVAPHPDLFDTELDSSLAGLDDSQIQLFTVDSNEAFSFLRSEPPTCGPPSTITVSSESAYDSPPSTYSSENYFSNYAGSTYAASTYSALELDMDIQRISLNSFPDFASSNGVSGTLDPTSFGPLPPTPPTSPPTPAHSVVKDYQKYVPRSFSDYAPGSRDTDFYSASFRPQATVSPTHISTQLPIMPSLQGQQNDDTNKADPRRKFKCNVCSRAFARAFNLKTHMATHDPNRQKPFVCHHRSCGRSFSRKHDLGRHLISIHRDDSVLPSQSSVSKKAIGVERAARAWCDVCGKSYFGKEASCGCHNIK